MISSFAFSLFSWVSLVSCCLNFCSISLNCFQDHFFVLVQLCLNTRRYVIFNDIFFVTSSNFKYLYNRFYFMAFLNFALCKLAMSESVSTNCFQQSCLCFRSSAAGLSICFGLFSPDLRRLPLLLSWFRPGRIATLSGLFLQMINSRLVRSSTELFGCVLPSLSFRL